ncbi:MAG: ferredoxin FdxA [Rickettsiaceae bacterium]
MTYIVNDKCIKCKYTDCVEVCPVDCFYEGELMLVINPDECIDCGVCEPECPIGAIEEESIENAKWITINKNFSNIWPKIIEKKPPLANAKLYETEKNKFEKYIK